MAMPHDTTRGEGNRSYGALLGEYFEVALEKSDLLDEAGRPPVDREAEFSQLQRREEALQERLREMEQEHEANDIETMLDRALPST
jgi:hypothetical protein